MISSIPEFIRGNQRSYLRIACDREELERDYEYHMYMRNDLKLLLPGSFRNIEGDEYLYFDISSRQSLDVFLQVRKLNREMAQRLFSDILRLCDETDKYLLNLRKVSFRSRHIMYSQERNNFSFLYNFSGQGNQWQQDLVQFGEMLVERLDYGDDRLMEIIYRFYEMLTDSHEEIDLRGLAQMVLNTISDSEKEKAAGLPEAEEHFPDREPWDKEAKERKAPVNDDNVWNMNETFVSSVPNQSAFGTPTEKVSELRKGKKKTKKRKTDSARAADEASSSTVTVKYRKSLLLEMILLLLADVVSLVLVEPGKISVLVLQIAAALICMAVIIRQLRNRKRDAEESREQEAQQQEAAAEEFREEFQNLIQTGDQILAGTQIIAMEEVFPKLYSVYGREPEYIEVVGHQLIGSQEDLVQVCLRYSGVSRIHASLRRDQQGNCVLEDLNSTNGTWVNDSRLSPRAPYTLNRGDKVSFAGCEYIFR